MNIYNSGDELSSEASRVHNHLLYCFGDLFNSAMLQTKNTKNSYQRTPPGFTGLPSTGVSGRQMELNGNFNPQRTLGLPSICQIEYFARNESRCIAT